MGMSKRLMFGRNPLDDGARSRIRQQTSDYLSEFAHRLPLKRKARDGARYWDNLWPISVQQAADELGHEVVNINEGLCAREAEHIEAIRTRAEAIWRGFKDRGIS